MNGSVPKLENGLPISKIAAFLLRKKKHPKLVVSFFYFLILAQKPMNILILGSGGREHALAKTISKSQNTQKLFILPGNAGTAKTGINVDIALSDFEAIKNFALEKSVELIICGPEDPLAEGIADFFAGNPKSSKIKFIGPKQSAARLESSKDFAKAFMQKHQIPTAAYQSFTPAEKNDAFNFLARMKAPYVLKADGLAAGKGVIITQDLETAKNALTEIFSGKFGDAGNKVVIEEYLDGIELSAFVLTDGKEYLLLPEAKDYKRIGKNDTGLNTGGMGAVSPVPFADKSFMQKVENKIIQPTIKGLQNEQIPYTGFIFFGLMKVGNEPYVIEYNVRLGDPETEVILPRIKSDFTELLSATANHSLSSVSLEIDPQTAASVILVSGGYPESYQKGLKISQTENVKDSELFHMGTKQDNDRLLTNGGRVMAVTSLAGSMKEALNISYKNAEKIQFEGKYYRDDIGFDL
jgi:phosphoribosylamine---glycine ligase